MLSEKQKKDQCRLFKTLPTLDRKLILVRIICYQDSRYGFEANFINEILKSGLFDEGGHAQKHALYQERVAKIVKLNFSLNKRDFLILTELHHPLLLLMTEKEMQWISSIVDKLYGHKPPDFSDLIERNHFYEEKGKIRTCLLMAIYSNKTMGKNG